MHSKQQIWINTQLCYLNRLVSHYFIVLDMSDSDSDLERDYKDALTDVDLHQYQQQRDNNKYLKKRVNIHKVHSYSGPRSIGNRNNSITDTSNSEEECTCDSSSTLIENTKDATDFIGGTNVKNKKRHSSKHHDNTVRRTSTQSSVSLVSVSTTCPMTNHKLTMTSIESSHHKSVHQHHHTHTKHKEHHRHHHHHTTQKQEDKHRKNVFEESNNNNHSTFSNDSHSHKIFTFSLPFGGTKQTEQQQQLSDHINTNSSNSDDSNNNNKSITKHDIKNKLMRSNSISSLEEQILFNDESGIFNVRNEAIKKSFQFDSLRYSIKYLIEDSNNLTDDGFKIRDVYHSFDDIDGDIVILGGYRGSTLRKKSNNKRLWIPLKESLTPGSKNEHSKLIIGPTPNDEYETQLKIYSDGMLTHCGPVDIARRLINKLSTNKNVTISDFGYDWRLSLSISGEQLANKLKLIYEKQKGDKKLGTYIIAHSMGGMVAQYVLQKYTHLIRGIIYVGCPIQCPNIMGPLRFGDEIMFNKTILSKEANFFMRSSFSFVPLDGKLFVDKTGKKRFDLDFLDPNIWIEYGLSPLVSLKRKNFDEENGIPLRSKKINDNDDENNSLAGSDNNSENNSILSKQQSNSNIHQSLSYLSLSLQPEKVLKNLNPLPILKNAAPIINNNNFSSLDTQFGKDPEFDEDDFLTPYEDSVEYLKHVLKSTKKFHDYLKFDPNKKYPPLVVVYGNKIPTIRGAKVNSLQDIKDGKYNDFYYGAGDGVIHQRWLLPERAGFPVEAKIASNTGHVSLMSDLDSMAKAFVALRQAEKRHNNNTDDISTEKKLSN